MASREAKICKRARNIMEMQRFRRNQVSRDPSFLEFVGRQIGRSAREVARLISDNAIDISRFLIEFLTRVPFFDAPAPIIPLPGLPAPALPPAGSVPLSDITAGNQARAGTKTKLAKPGQAIPPPPVRIPSSGRAAGFTPGAPPASQDPPKLQKKSGSGGTARRIPDSPGGDGSGSRNVVFSGSLNRNILTPGPILSSGSQIVNNGIPAARLGRRVTRPQDNKFTVPSSQIQFLT